MGKSESFDSAVELAADIRRRAIGPVEALEACLDRVDRLNPVVNAVVWRNDEEARAHATRAQEALTATEADELPPFHGVPIPIKDLAAVAGWPVTYGSHGAPTAPSAESELVVEALRRAGFILCGRTNTPEFGPITATENVRYGPTRNPWNPQHTPGGSSGGAGAAVAAGMFRIAHASDGGGSIRIPGSCCGLVGLKPSRGRVPSRSTMWEGAATDGAVTRTVGDAAAVLDAICGPDPLSWWNAPAPKRPFAEQLDADPGELRIGVVEQAPLGLPLDPACAEAARRGASALEELGHAVETVAFDTLPEELIEAFRPVVAAGLAEYDDVDWTRVEPHNAAGRQAALQVDSITYRTAVRALQGITRPIVAHWGRDFDVLLTPTLSIEPPEVGTVLAAAHASPGEPAHPVIQMIAFTLLANITGLPAISLPLHVSDSGLPVGVQLIGGPWDEARLVNVAAQLERAEPWADRRPDLEPLAAGAPPASAA
jgi:amidase